MNANANPTFKAISKPSLFGLSPAHIKASTLVTAPGKILLLLAAGVLIVGQLIALGMLAQEQVHLADKRASLLAIEQTAAAACYQSSGVFAASVCLVKAREGFAGHALSQKAIPSDMSVTRLQKGNSGSVQLVSASW